MEALTLGVGGLLHAGGLVLFMALVLIVVLWMVLKAGRKARLKGRTIRIIVAVWKFFSVTYEDSDSSKHDHRCNKCCG